jgi:hypothetical protein
METLNAMSSYFDFLMRHRGGCIRLAAARIRRRKYDGPVNPIPGTEWR